MLFMHDFLQKRINFFLDEIQFFNAFKNMTGNEISVAPIVPKSYKGVEIIGAYDSFGTNAGVSEPRASSLFLRVKLRRGIATPSVRFPDASTYFS